MTSLQSKTADYIIVGGGIAGAVLASRLSLADSSLSITLIEAGPDCSGHSLASAPLSCFGAHYSPIDYAYLTTPQKHLNNRALYSSGGKILSGGSAVNYGTWTRGPAVDYDAWAEEVGDQGWSYRGLLPYFKKVEGCVEGGSDAEQHGFDGPVKVASISESGRKYPLDQAIASAWNELGTKKASDGNGGYPLGMAALVESFGVDGRRQTTSSIYDLSRVTVLTNTPVHRVLLSTAESKEPTATGVQLVSGETITAKKEIILAAGAYRTPQLLMLSGIGNAKELAKHDIKMLVSSPEVGRNFWDHPSVYMWWQLRHPERGLAIGTSNPNWNNPSNGYDRGMPVRDLVFDSVPVEKLAFTLQADGEGKEHHLLKTGSVHTETFISYSPGLAEVAQVPVPVDGSHIASILLNLAPTSRGSITLSSANPEANPVIDPNFCATETDKEIFRHGIRKMLKLILGTRQGKEIVEKETPPPGYKALDLNATDEEIDERMRRVVTTFFHAAGTASMGKVVDTELRVNGVKGLRVCDASVLPVGMAAHLQACVYAVAEKGADILLKV